jgi:hypothetical protein
VTAPATRPATMARRVSAVVLIAVVVALGTALAVAATARPAGADSSVAIATTIDGTAAGGSSPAHPVVLQPDQPANIDIEVTNDGGDSVALRTVRLTGVVTGLTFFSYQTSVNLTVEPGQSTHLRYSLDLTGLDGQATGLVPARISVSDADHHTVASQSFVSDVRGSLESVYGLFGLALLALTGLAFAGVLWAVATHRIPRNRWRRGMRLLTVGLGLGLVMVFTLSALRVWVPSPGRWVVTVLGFAVIFFVIGYLTPTPTGDDEEELDESEFTAKDDATEVVTTPVPPPPPPAPAPPAGEGAP